MVDVIVNNQIDLLHVHYAIPHASAAYMTKKILGNTGQTYSGDHHTCTEPTSRSLVAIKHLRR